MSAGVLGTPTQSTEVISRQSPEIEAYKLGLLDLAKQRGEQPVNLPQQQVAGMTNNQQTGINLAQQGIGSYQPYMQGAQNYMGQAAGGFGAAPGLAQGYAQSGINANQQYTNQGLQQGQQYAQQGLQQGAQQGQSAYNTAQGLGSLANNYASQGYNQVVNPAQQGAAAGLGLGLAGTQSYDPNSVNSYMNPYTQNVIDSSMNEINRQAAQSRQATASNAVAAGAFGGSRDAVMRANLEKGIMDTKANTISNLENQNFGQAQNASINNFQNQQARTQQAGNMALQGGQMVSNAGLGSLNMGAQTALQNQSTMGNLGMNYANMLQSGNLQAGNMLGAQGLQAGQQLGQQYYAGGQLASGAQLDAARGLGSLATTSGQLGGLNQAYGQADSSFIYNMGANEQKQNQAQLDASYNNQLQGAYEPFQRISWMNDIYSGAPSDQQTLTSQSSPQASPMSQIVGAGIAGYGALNAFNKATSSFGS